MAERGRPRSELPDHKVREFVQALVAANGDATAAWRATHPDSPDKYPRQRAWRLMRRDDVQAYFREITDELELTPRDVARFIKDKMYNSKLYGLNQKTGEAVTLGDDNRAQLQAAELLGRFWGVLGPAPRTEASGTTVIIVRSDDPLAEIRDVTPE